MKCLIDGFRIFKHSYSGLEEPITGASSSSPSSGATTSLVGGEAKYDVFLSFRGEDTRDNFTDHLYHALCDALIKTFLDDREIRTGETLKPELEEAIRGSKVAIIVISKKYATSTWCLDELALILEEKEKDKNRIVIPIFYHVEPSHVRKLKNSFKKAMRKHQKTAKTDPLKKRRIMRWKAALQKVPDLKGKVVKGSEHNFIQEIVRDINDSLDRKASITNLPLLIGRNDLVGEINSWLANGSSNAADIFTICGITGIGKTTLAKYIYHSNVGQPFDGRSFLQDIAKESNTILSLQKSFLLDIGMGSQEMSNADTSARIQRVLQCKKLFIVLDDINDVGQLNSLLGNGGFHPGTKVIITTNDRSLPEKIKDKLCNYNYEERLLEGLSEDASLELLCEHAFGSNCLKEGFEKLSREVAAYCGGHPLALEVLGKSLFNQNIRVWEDTLNIWKKEFNFIIWRALQVTVNFLGCTDKEVFKDVACFLVGERKEFVETILGAPSGIQNLINYCLLTVDPDSNHLKMAQLIREMGRDMVRQGLLENPTDQSKLRCHEECFNLFRQGKETGDIKCFILDMTMVNQEISGEINKLETVAFKQMKSPNLLKLNFVTLDGSYAEFSPCLKQLCWNGFPLKHLCSHGSNGELSKKALVALDMFVSELEQWEPPEELPALKILDLSMCSELTRAQGFSKRPKLERLALKGCTILVEVDESIWDLCRLIHRDINSLGQLLCEL